MYQDNIFLLLRLGLGTDHSDSATVSALRALPLPELRELFDIAHKQSVTGIAVDGLFNSNELSDTPCAIDEKENEDYRYALLGEQYNYEQAATKQKAVLSKISGIWKNKGLRPMLMKGWANSLYYPVPFHRTTGDIDVFMLDNGYESGNDALAEAGAKVDTHWYKHSQIRCFGQMIENHRKFVHTRDGRRSKELDDELRALTVQDSYNMFPETEICLPPVQFNALFLTYHSMAHFLSEGITLKHVADWAIFLKAEWKNVDWKAFNEKCERYHMKRYADVMNDIAVHKLGVDLDETVVNTSSPYTQRVIDSIFNDDDKVFSSGKSGWHNRFKIVSNTIKYSWKFHKIYRGPVCVKLWQYLAGYLFKNE